MIDNLLDEIARAQMAKKQYTQAGRQDLAQGAQNWGTQQAQKLAGQGIQLSPDADLTSRFTQKYGDQFAGTYDPMKQGQVLRDNPNLKPKQMDYYNELERVRIDPATGKKYVPTSSGIKHVMDLLNKQKQYNDSMALGFSDRYGVPIKPMEKLEDLFAQVKGMKPLNIEQRDYERSWKEDDRKYDRTWNEDERTYNREKYETDFNSKRYTNDAIGKVLTFNDKQDAIDMINELGPEMLNRGVDMASVWAAITERFPDAKQTDIKIPIPTYDKYEWDSEQDYWDFVERATGNPK